MSENSENKSILELAKEHQLKCWMGKHQISHGGKIKNYRYKQGNCHMCGRLMDVPEFENSPYYCYKCDEEAETVLRDSSWTNRTMEEHLREMKEKKDYEDYYNGKPFTAKR